MNTQKPSLSPHVIFFMLVCKLFEVSAETIVDEMVNSLGE